jgi:hypothetical protein
VTLHSPINSLINMAGDMGTPEVDMHALDMHSGDVSRLDHDDVSGSGSGSAEREAGAGAGGDVEGAAAGMSEGAGAVPSIRAMTPVRPNRVPGAAGQPEAYIEIEWTPDWTP